MRQALCGCALLVIVGCGGDESAGVPEAQVTDSAGVTIVTSPPGDDVHAALGAEPTLTIGALEGSEELLFDGIASVVRDGDGNFLVADNGSGEIRVFDTEGRHLRTFGGRGEGPGEFQVLVGAWLLPDGSVVAADRRLQRISRFDAQGTLLGAGTLTGVESMDIVTPVGLAGSGTFLSRVRALTVPSASSLEDAVGGVEEAFGGDESPPEYFVRYRLDGTRVDTVASHPGRMMSVSTAGSGTNVSLNLLRVPFSPEPAASGSNRGVAITGGTAYEVGVFDATGALSRIVRLAEAPTARAEEHLEAYVRGSGNPFAQDEASIRAMIAGYREMPLPETLPTYTKLRTADTGELWARRYSQRGAPHSRWDVFGADGRFLGRVEVPSSFSIEEVGGGEVVGVSTDDLGVQRVEVRELILGGG